ncbi:hypothetical protein K474DRAFT_1658389 [Panus rudis PR-1116 ss-1]|nr:hypothetical protein K474DRAFT_1658389 [Panus rudis PR-1116 ss-1]
MHPALQVDEILSLILAHFALPTIRWLDRESLWNTRTLKRTLAAAARTCRAFHDPALALLWEHQTSLMPLLKTLPSFQRDEQYIYTLSAPVHPKHWARFQSYARRIRTFVYTPNGCIHSSVFPGLAAMLDGQPLMPSLRRMLWVKAFSLGDDMKLFISPSLREVEVSLIGRPSLVATDSHDLEALLHSLVHIAVDLEHLTVEGSVTTKSTSYIAGFKRLRSLNLNGAGSWVDLEAFYALAALPFLETLRINTAQLALEDGHHPSAFRSLRTLQISGTPSAIDSVLRIVSSERVRSISIRTSYSYKPNEWRTCFDTILTRFANKLTEFHIKLIMGSLSMSADSDDFLFVVEPLLGISSLHVVDIHLEGHLRVSDADIHTMASSWRELRELRIWCHKSGDGPSLQSLASCASLCPRLHQLELPIDARNRANQSHLHPHRFTSSRAIADKPSQTLRYLVLSGNVGIEEPAMVSRRIRTLFPALQRFEAYSWDPAMNAMWQEVKDSIRTLHSPNKAGLPAPSRRKVT